MQNMSVSQSLHHASTLASFGRFRSPKFTALNGRRRLVPNLLGERFQQTTMPLTAIQHARAIGVLLGTAAGDGKYI